MSAGALLEPAIRALGIKGVSTAVLVFLVAIALYAHKAATVGGTVVRAGATAQHDLKVVALVLAALLMLGVLSADPNRAQELIQLAQHRLAQLNLLDRLVGSVS